MIEFRLSGSGGQGLILAGIILAEAAIGDGKEAVQSQSYGPEARGGSSKSEVIVSDKAIYFPKVLSPDFLLAMTAEALSKYGSDLKKQGILVIDSTYVKEVPETFGNIYSVPITQMAKEQLGRDLFANIIALGVLAKLSQAVSLEALEKAVLNRVPKGTEDINRKALALGYDAV
jgi:2-oxoglutarate ferredoxin oxidoreductase subunit gamma